MREYAHYIMITSFSFLMIKLIPKWVWWHVRQIGTYHHEMSHGIVSLLTGGKFHKFRVYHDGSGVCLTSEGNSSLIVSAGYLGSIIFGLLFVTLSFAKDNIIWFLYGLLVVYVLSVLKAGNVRAMGFAISLALVMWCISTVESKYYQCLTLNFIGVVLFWDGFLSLWYLFRVAKDPNDQTSDASLMSKLCGQHPAIWAMIYSVLSVVFIIVLVIGVMVRNQI
ncbi:M50 family metallopeptidase [bacterium]|nr:M50 family metallopeptidase [bacterium]